MIILKEGGILSITFLHWNDNNFYEMLSKFGSICILLQLCMTPALYIFHIVFVSVNFSECDNILERKGFQENFEFSLILQNID